MVKLIVIIILENSFSVENNPLVCFLPPFSLCLLSSGIKIAMVTRVNQLTYTKIYHVALKRKVNLQRGKIRLMFSLRHLDR